MCTTSEGGRCVVAPQPGRKSRARLSISPDVFLRATDHKNSMWGHEEAGLGSVIEMGMQIAAAGCEIYNVCYF